MFTAGITIHAAANSRNFNILGAIVPLKNLTLTGGDVFGQGGVTKRHEKAQNGALQTKLRVSELFVSLGDFSWPLLCLAA